MESGPSAKQQIVEQLKTATNILVTVSNNPSVDELSAALAFTLMLNKIDKHATAVFSGAIPPAIEFLDPEKTFEGTVDSLRDFIIALDKEKADRLRYKVEGEMVKIFITPYRTTITNKDLEFSQGDFNVEVIVALGVEQREALDQAIVSHGRILHDATVITINATAGKNALGAVNWQEPNASSLCEMLMSLSEALQTGLIDEQISTALLTGIVAATERFSNEHTTPRVMTMSAQLMAAGANQQLIATKLQQGHAIPNVNNDGSTNLQENASTKVKKQKPPKKKADGEMDIMHEKHNTAEDIAKAKQQDAVKAAENALAEALPSPLTSNKAPSIAELEQEIKKEAQVSRQFDESPKTSSAKAESKEPEPQAPRNEHPSWMGKRIEPPSLGGTLNATTDQAFEDKEREEEEDRNKTILTHGNASAAKPVPAPNPVVKAEAKKITEASPPPPALPSVPSLTPPAESAPVAQTITPSMADQLPPVAEPASPDHVDNARQAVEAALHAQPFEPSHQPLVSLGTQPLKPTTAAATVPPPMPPVPTAPVSGGVPLPPMPDFGSLPPMPPLPTNDPAVPTPPPLGAPLPDPYGPPPLHIGGNTPPAPPPTGKTEPAPPNQFKIPGH